jgi:molybdopterin-dependent oxidoreductase alpha subunit
VDSRGDSHNAIVGGGAKKILYTLQTVKRIGLKNSAKAMSSHNTCKACGLGMGGQRGGMINEMGEFPSVCNKSVQAQSTDIQPGIPLEVFEHSLADFRELSAHNLEHMGRLNNPIFKAKDSDKYQAVDWDWAIQYSAKKFGKTEANRSFMYSSGRSSNEAGFVLQLLARLYGTNNVNNCSYYCHQATGVGLANSIGTGTSTVELEDLAKCDLIFLIGANPASNHPRFIYQLKNCRERGGQVVVINPAKEPGLVKFAVPKSPKSMLAGGSEIASRYLQPKVASDLALLKGLAKAILELGAENSEFITQYTECFEAFKADIESTTWSDVCDATGLSQSKIEDVAQLYAKAERAVFAWGMGITHHRNGVENVEYISNLALLRGMLGKQNAGLLPLRGHSNVQGIGTIGVKPVLPDEVISKLQSEYKLELPTEKGMDTLACLEAASEGQIDAALIMGGNLYEATPQSKWAAKSLDQIGFKLFLTTTLNRGHFHGLDNGESLVLPVTARDEERQATTQESMFSYVRLSDGGIKRHEGTRPEVDILCDIATQLVPDAPIDFSEFKQHKKIREAIAKVVPGMQDLADIDVAKREFHIRGRIMHKPEFKTSTGKAQFIVREIADNIANQGFPFLLTSIRSEGQFNSIIYEEKDSYRGVTDRWTVLMNSMDMRKLGIEEGGKADISSTEGEMSGMKVKSYGIPEGNLMAYYPEVNILIGTERDPRSKTPAFKSVPVAIKKVKLS